MEPTHKHTHTELQYQQALEGCRTLFAQKMIDYGVSWRVLRPLSITDQIFIKVKRLRTLQSGKEAHVEESLREVFTALVNYGIMGLIQLKLGAVDNPDVSTSEAMQLYNEEARGCYQLMLAKNHDYGEAWRDMRLSSLVDLIYTKVLRTKQIEGNNGETLVSEGVSGNYSDIVNYALFALIRLSEEPEVSSR